VSKQFTPEEIELMKKLLLEAVNLAEKIDKDNENLAANVWYITIAFLAENCRMQEPKTFAVAENLVKQLTTFEEDQKAKKGTFN